MQATEKFQNNELVIEREEKDAIIEVRWSGRSAARKPAEFINPILTGALETARKTGKELVMDFQVLKFMNSSTITPISKILEMSQPGTEKVSIVYNSKKNWQELSFSALKIFETDDGRIKISGK